MSDEQQGSPYGGQQGQHGQHAPTEWIGSDDPPQGGSTPVGGDGGSGRRRGRLVAVGVGVAALALIGGVALAFQVLSGGGPQPADAIPASAIGYARIDLDPSADQKVNALRLLRSVPQFEEETGITSDTDDLRKRLFEESLADSEGCSDIDYEDDIEPWIGDRAGGAAIPAGEGEEPDAVVVVQVSDEDAARDGMQALIECDATEDEGGDEAGGLAFVGDYALLAETQELADEFAAAAEEEPLSEAEGFSSDMEALDGEGLMSFWLDLDAVVAAAEESEPELTTTLEALGYDELGSVSVAVRAQSDALELVYAGDGELLNLVTASSEPVGDIQALPESTLMAAGFTGGRESVDRVWEQLQELEASELGGEFGGGFPGTLEEFAAQLEAETGFAIPDDVGVLLGDEFTLAVDGEGFELAPDTGEPDLSTINVGARLRTDADAAADLVARVQELLAQGGAPFEIAQEEVDGGLVIAANDGYAETLASGGDLGDSDAFGAAVADADDAVSVAFVDIDKVEELVVRIADDIGEPLPAEAMETLEVFRAVGASTTVDGDYTRTTIRVVFD